MHPLISSVHIAKIHKSDRKRRYESVHYFCKYNTLNCLFIEYLFSLIYLATIREDSIPLNMAAEAMFANHS